jgi:hypothetical protein
MNRAGSMSLRARINNYAKRERVSPQLALQGFFIERFLARIDRRSEVFLSRWRETVRDIASSDFQKQQWARYQKRMPYARDIPFDDLVGSLSGLLEKTVGGYPKRHWPARKSGPATQARAGRRLTRGTGSG